MIFRRWLPVSIVAIGFLVAPAAWAVLPDPLPRTITGAQNELTAGQRAEIDRYVNACVDELIAIGQKKSDTTYADVRTKLTAPMASLSVPFTNTYGAVCAERFPRALAKDQPLAVRLNVLIAASSLVGVPVLDVAELGLADSHPAVRYWGAKCLARLVARGVDLGRERLPSDAQRRVLRMVGPVLDKERRASVVRHLIDTLIGLEEAEADALVLKALDDRIEHYAANPGDDVTVIVDGLSSISRKLVQRTATKAEQQQIVKVSYRYLSLAAQLQMSKRLNKVEQDNWQEVAISADQRLRFWVRQLGVDKAKLPQQSVGRTTPPAIYAAAVEFEWPALLKDVGIDVSKLKVKLPKESDKS